MQWGMYEGGAARTPPQLPDVVFVRMANYRGIQQFEEPRQRVIHGGETVDLCNVVPIASIETIYDDSPARGRRGGGAPEAGSARCIRTQLPLMLAFTVTIHKNQRCTVDRVVVDIGRNERADGKSFTVLSLCREFCGMLFETFDVARLVPIGRSNSFPARIRAVGTITRLEDRTLERRGLPAETKTPRPTRLPDFSGLEDVR